ncbi:MAG: MFS transporter [Bilophila wadsworthia]
MLFSAWSGWLADRFAKKSLVICAKTLELAAMLAGAWGMVTLDWNWMLAMTFCMGLSSTLFSPALNGSIPELFPVGQVPRINALFKLGTTASILFGCSSPGSRWIGHGSKRLPLRPLAGGDIGRDRRGRGLVSTAFIPRTRESEAATLSRGRRSSIPSASCAPPQGWPAAPCHLGGSVLLFPLDPAVARDQ